MIAYLCAYWDWLRGKSSAPPNPAQFGLDEHMAEVLRRQADLHFKSQADFRKEWVRRSVLEKCVETIDDLLPVSDQLLAIRYKKHRDNIAAARKELGDTK